MKYTFISLLGVSISNHVLTCLFKLEHRRTLFWGFLRVLLCSADPGCYNNGVCHHLHFLLLFISCLCSAFLSTLGFGFNPSLDPGNKLSPSDGAALLAIVACFLTRSRRALILPTFLTTFSDFVLTNLITLSFLSFIFSSSSMLFFFIRSIFRVLEPCHRLVCPSL